MVAKPIRLTAAIFLAFTVAGLVFLQSASGVLTRKQPAMSVQLFSLNGLAQAQLASRQFQAEIADQDDIAPSAKLAADAAKRAFALEPLTPKTHAILAIAEDDFVKQNSILDAALTINRRDLLLQGLILKAEIDQRDYRGSLATLDRILRVHPEQSATFFPLLVQVLERDAALPEIASLLDGNSNWHASFLGHAARQTSALPNLAKLRMQNKSADPEIDRHLINGLAAGGQTDLSFRIYNAAVSNRTAPYGAGRLDWITEFPPFDWQLQNEAGFRAQPSRNGNELEIFVRDGKGGIVAQRRLAAPSGDLSLSFSHSLQPENQIKDARLLISCPGDKEPFYDRSLSPGKNSFELGNLLDRCKFIDLALYVRVWTGSPKLQGNIGQLQLTAR